MEKRKAKGFSNAGEDLISKLPDSLISQMLLYLPTKEAVKTCVLSNRWKSLWLLIPELDLDSNEFPDYDSFVSFMDRFLDFSREHKSCLHKLKLSIRKEENDQSCLTRWIDFVATPKLQHLDVECLLVKRERIEVMPLSLCIWETLLYLRLHRVSLVSFESVYLPCVKTMRLEHNVYANEAGLESLISSCPVLEDLSIVRRTVDDNVKVLRVHSQTLTCLSIGVGEPDDWLEGFDYENLGEVIIDAPRLKYLTFEDDMSMSITISNSDSLTKVNILGHFFLTSDERDLQKRYSVRNFLTSISGVRDMKISWMSFESFLETAFVETTVPSPQFCNLSCLKVELYLCRLKFLPKFLESCPNLRSLILDLLPLSMSRKEVELSFVPQCLLSSLEFVEIKSKSRESFEVELELARYFAENSVILKKLVLRLRDFNRGENTIVSRDLFALPKRSSTCQIIVC